MRAHLLEKIRAFTDGEVDYDEAGLATAVRFEMTNTRFEFMYSDRMNIAMLEIRSTGLLLHYEFPVGDIEVRPEESLRDGIHSFPALIFFSQEDRQHVLSLTRNKEVYHVDPICTV